MYEFVNLEAWNKHDDTAVNILNGNILNSY